VNVKEIAIYLVIMIVGIILASHMNVVVSGSMEPVIYRGDDVILGAPTNLHVGDIAVYHATWFDQPVIHRIIMIKQLRNGIKVYEFKGDNNPVPDPYWVYPNQIISKVVTINGQPLIIPKIGYITIWSKDYIFGQNI
jgi:signal peptidase